MQAFFIRSGIIVLPLVLLVPTRGIYAHEPKHRQQQNSTQSIRENQARLLRLLTGANSLTDKRDLEAIRKYDLAPVIPRIYFDGIQWEQRWTPLRFPEATH
jgi:hypothetical protein